MTPTDLAQALRVAADAIEAHFAEQAATAAPAPKKTTKSKAKAAPAEAVDVEAPAEPETIEAPAETDPAQLEPVEPAEIDADSLKRTLADYGKQHGTPVIRNLVIETIGEFKPSAKMTPEQRAKVLNALESM